MDRRNVAACETREEVQPGNGEDLEVACSYRIELQAISVVPIYASRSLILPYLPVNSGGSAELGVLLKQGDVLLKLLESARVRPPRESVASSHSRLGHLKVKRGEIAEEVERAFSAAIEATRQHGHLSRKAEERWKKFKAELRHLTTATLLLTRQLIE